MEKVIHHEPYLDVNKAAELYTEKDGVEVKYVCTSAIESSSVSAADIFYSETPHPEFGNRYFGVFVRDKKLMIINADNIENLEFYMIEDGDSLYYSRHRHDFYGTPSGYAIDGGREYGRTLGNAEGLPQKQIFKIKDGSFQPLES